MNCKVPKRLHLFLSKRTLFPISPFLMASIMSLWVSFPRSLSGNTSICQQRPHGVSLPVIDSNTVRQVTGPSFRSRCLSHDKQVLRILHLLPTPTCTLRCQHQSFQDSGKFRNLISLRRKSYDVCVQLIIYIKKEQDASEYLKYIQKKNMKKILNFLWISSKISITPGKC